MPDVEAEFREQLVDAFEGADYPVSSPMDLLPVLPDGPATRFEAGDVSLSAMELSTKLGSYQDFPYESVEALVDDIIEGMRETDLL